MTVVYLAVVLTLVVLTIVGVTKRTRKDGVPEAAIPQLVGGLNVFAAGVIAFMTMCAMAATDVSFLLGATALLSVVLCFVWVTHGLVPVAVAVDQKGWWILFFGHALLLIGTVVHGSVTFFLPLYVWLGWMSKDAGTVLPWFALITTPFASFVWIVGIWLVWGSQLNDSRERTSED